MNKRRIGIIHIKRITANSCVIFLLLFLIWVLLGFNTKMADKNSYTLFFSFAQNGIRYPGVEWGFYFFMRICAFMGLDYQGFLIVYSLIGTLLIGNSIKSYSINRTAWIIMLFIFFPYLHILAAVRNFMAFAIILWSIRYLISNEKGRIVKYCICIVIAATFHISALFALLYLLSFLPFQKVKYITIVFSVIGLVSLLLGNYIINLLISIIPKLHVYLSLGTEGTRSTTKLFLVIYFLGKIILCNLLQSENNQDGQYPLNILGKINMLTVVAFPLCVFNMNFMRIEYDMLIVMSIYVYNSLYLRRNQTIDRSNNKVIGVLYPMYYFISGYILLYLFSYESVVKTIWENNLFFDLFKIGV